MTRESDHDAEVDQTSKLAKAGSVSSLLGLAAIGSGAYLDNISKISPESATTVAAGGLSLAIGGLILTKIDQKSDQPSNKS